VANRRKQQNDIGYKRKEQKKHVQALSGQTQQDGVLAEEIARSTFACGTSIVMHVCMHTKIKKDVCTLRSKRMYAH
jgi:hypothetical protein